LTAVQPSGRFGALALEGSQVVVFTEKPEREAAFVSGGFFVFQKSIGDYLDDDTCVLEQEPCRRLAREGQLHAFQHTGFWQCMDTIREQELLNKVWRTGQAPWKIW
jgi:glucose-1-phosphate cytidylyltransferase